MRLVIAEKPSMGRAIATALGVKGTGRHHLGGGELVITWCVGHLVEAMGPEAYDPGLKRWTLATLPFLPETFRYEPIASSLDQWQEVRQWLQHPDVTEVVNATDAGREGQLIFHLAYALAECSKPVKRLWTSSLTDAAILDAWKAMKPESAYQGLTDAARCRQEADWMVGLNCTRAQTLMARAVGLEGVFSIGRVQTPTLAMLVQRELEIRDFVPKDFWTVLATFRAEAGDYEGKWYRTAEGKEIDRLDTEAEARAIVDRVQGRPALVHTVAAKDERKRPELLYDLTALQKEANKRFGLTAEKTLEIAQKLYESKLISYPRTNSRHLTEADAAKAPQWLQALADGQNGKYAGFAAEVRAMGTPKLGKRFVDDKEVEDHSALVPTEKSAQGLMGDEAAVYDLIARRLLAAWFPDRVEAKTTVVTRVAVENPKGVETFKSLGTVVKDLGWTRVDPPASGGKEGKPDAALPLVKKGEPVETLTVGPKAGKTSPPKPMTEGDLLGSMQTAGRDLDDESLRGAMKDCGLGTPATRANIIETLIKRQYVERKTERKNTMLRPTEKGIALIRSIEVDALKSPLLTGQWEAAMERIRRGEHQRDKFMTEVRDFVRDLVVRIQAKPPDLERIDLGSSPTSSQRMGDCPRCKRPLILHRAHSPAWVRCSGVGPHFCGFSYETTDDGTPSSSCRFCNGPVRTSPHHAPECLTCGRPQNDAPQADRPAAPPLVKCERCKAVLRQLWSAKKTRWYQRCDACDTWNDPPDPGKLPPEPAVEPCKCGHAMMVLWSAKKSRWYLLCAKCGEWKYP